MKNGTADLGILIGERKECGKGYGGEALGLVLKMLLQDATIRKITAGAMSENKGMIKLACGCGMKIEAVIPKYFFGTERKPTSFVWQNTTDPFAIERIFRNECQPKIC